METNLDSAESLSAAGFGVLLPCPFCGRTTALEIITGRELMDDEQEYWQHSEAYGVICNAARPYGKGGCGAMGGFADTETAAATRWNTRTPNPAPALSAWLGAWVRCAERMPERWEPVLLALAGMVPLTTFVWTGERWQVGVSDTQYPYTPEFWMPLPEAPNVK